MGRVADYVIGILAEILDEEPEREKTYEWALGDRSPKTGVRRRLPFDACWESRKLIVEVDENQHREAVPFWDKPAKMTVSGVHRGEQRKKYDKDKRAAARLQGYRVIELPWDRRPVPAKRDREADKASSLNSWPLIQIRDENTARQGYSSVTLPALQALK